MSRVANLMIQADFADGDTVQSLSDWLRKEAPTTSYGDARIRLCVPQQHDSRVDKQTRHNRTVLFSHVAR
ncbi:MAG: hypothetical protein IRY85_15640 [Micromonosporaceae bacterium]|nr:hypothetical protein [Micromonosporaceae bacterium]